MAGKTMKAPKHLKGPTRRWWASVVGEYELEPHHVRLLTLAGEAWDRCVQAREALAEHGLTFVDGHGSPRARPECGVERDARTSFARLLRELGLDVQPPSESRAPAIGANAFRKVGGS